VQPGAGVNDRRQDGRASEAAMVGRAGPGTAWRERAGTQFRTEKHPVTGHSGVVVTNHPLASASGLQMLADGGNAVDAAVAALFTLSVVEPMMVGIFGAGWTLARLPDGRTLALDGYSCAPGAATEEMFRPVSDDWPDYLQAQDRENTVGFRAVGVPGSLAAWTQLLAEHGRLDLPTVLEPAIGHARRGFRVSRYLHELICQNEADLRTDREVARIFLPGDRPPPAGHLLRQPELADSLAAIARGGPAALYGGDLGRVIADGIAAAGGILTLRDLIDYRTVRRDALTGEYRGHRIAVPPPPSAGGVHLLQMLRLLEGFDVAGMGFGTADGWHLLAECCAIAFADRDAHLGDPRDIPVPVDWLTSARYAAQRRAGIAMDARGRHRPGVPTAAESATTTHVTVADAEGTAVAMTQTINNAFGAKAMVPGTGILLNNTMALFDPHPGRPNSVAGGRRSVTSMSPAIVTRADRPVLALGTPGGVRIFPAVLQALVNVIDHGMTLQEAVEAPRVWTQGQQLEVEHQVPQAIRAELRRRGHDVVAVDTVAGGMNGIAVDPDDGTMTGAACWRADGAPVALGGGPARPGIRFRSTVGR
jgi:gamma-glutamyltranspeptidase/glutathione hydrolase